MYLGLDIGTSSVKGVLIDGKQKIVATGTSPLTVSRPNPGWSEQDPEHWWKACNKAVKALPSAEAEGDRGGRRHRPLRPAAWRDAARQVRQGPAPGDPVERCALLRGMPRRSRRASRERARSPAIFAMAGFTAPKLVWVKKHEPRVFEKVAKVLLPKDYVRLRHDRRICLRHVGFVRHLLARCRRSAHWSR